MTVISAARSLLASRADTSATDPDRDADHPRVRVEGGFVRGVTDRGIDSWRAIPYVRPPTGRYRLRAPGPVVPLSRYDGAMGTPICGHPLRTRPPANRSR
jgi:carboxylesterase type B